MNGTELIYGSDRLVFVERALGRHSAVQSRLVPDRPKHAVPSLPPQRHRTVTFFYDFSSPWSYIASTQIERVLLVRLVSLFLYSSIPLFLCCCLPCHGIITFNTLKDTFLHAFSG